MSIALLGGSVSAALAATIACVASLLQHENWWTAALYCATAIPCAEVLRRGLQPLGVVVAQVAAIALLRLPVLTGHSPVATIRLLADVATQACVGVAISTTVLLVIPRRSARLPPRCRIRCEHIVFSILVNVAWVCGVAMLALQNVQRYPAGGPQNAAASVTDPLCCLLLGALAASFALSRTFEHIARRTFENCSVTRRDGAVRKICSLSAALPQEFAALRLKIVSDIGRLERSAQNWKKRLDSVESLAERQQSKLRTIAIALDRAKLQFRKVASGYKIASSRYKALMTHCTDAVLFTGLGGTTIRAVNPAAEALLGFSAKELVGKPVQFLIPPEHLLEHPLDLARTEGERLPDTVDTVVRTAGGKTADVTLHLSSVSICGARSYGIHLRHSGHMRAAAAKIKEAGDLVKSAQRSRDLFIGMMSHELRTPLHGLIATLDMLRVSSPGSSEFCHHLEIARVSARTLLKICDDILDITRIRAGQFPLERRLFSLSALIKEIVEASLARARALGIDLDVLFANELPPSFIGDPVRLKQIISNLLSNALKCTSKGWVKIHVQYDGRQCVIDVVDTGKGVPRDKWESIFEPFVQLESGSTQAVGGTGLGLPISRQLAKAMGGSLVLLKSGNFGSTFRLSLALEASQEAAPEDQSQRILHNPRGRVLVVEDNASNRYVAEALLKSFECPATIVESGAQALELLGNQEFDLILMDCQMPDMDGYETTRRARQILKRRLPIIAMTANATAEDRSRCLDAGMDDFLAKPFGRSALWATLCKWLDQSGYSNAENTAARQLSNRPALDADVFDELRQSLQWKTDSLRRIRSNFVATVEDVIRALESDDGSDGHGVLRQMHTLVGSSGMVGAREIEHLAAKLQEAVKAGCSDQVRKFRMALRPALERFAHEFDCRLESWRDAPRAGSSHQAMY